MRPSAPRDAFTLIEILIVISILGVLISLLIPSISMAKKKLREVQCSNNLQQIGIGIETFRQDKDDLFPGRLVDLFDKNANGPYEWGLTKLMVCPADLSHGHGKFNRMTGWDQYPELQEDILDPGRSPTRPAPVKLAPCSYLYEASEQTIIDTGLIAAFFPHLAPGDRPTTTTWAEGKRSQQKHGNLDAFGAYGAEFPSSLFPMLRCFWHEHWTTTNSRVEQRVLNLSWDLNVFKSIPYWENTINPAFNVP